MRFVRDKILKLNYEKKLKNLKNDFDDSDPMFLEQLLSLHKEGFDDGCNASSIYSDHLKKLYEPLDESLASELLDKVEDVVR